MLTFSEDLKQALNAVSQDVAPELKDAGPEEIAECCMDAGRLTTWGFEVEDIEHSVLIDIYGYPAVLAEATKHVATW